MRPRPAHRSHLSRAVHEICARLLPHLILKTVGVTVFITAFFFIYFWLLNSPAFAVRVIPCTALDRIIVFQPWALGLYLSLWVYAPIPAMLAPTRLELYAYGWHAGMLAALGLAIFYFWPTKILPADVDWSRHPGYDFLKGVDAAGNACPSLHVAFSVFAALHIGALLRRARAPDWAGWVNWLWCIGIAYSTLATKQHVALDLFAGTALGACGGIFIRGRMPPHPPAPMSEERALDSSDRV